MCVIIMLRLPRAAARAYCSAAARRAYLASREWGRLRGLRGGWGPAKLDAPTWGRAAASLTEIAGASIVAEELTEQCPAGVVSACDALSADGGDITFVGHSNGGLVSRWALGALEERGVLERWRPNAFVSLSPVSIFSFRFYFWKTVGGFT